MINHKCRRFYINLKESWLHVRDSDAPSACSERGDKQWQHHIRGLGYSFLIMENTLNCYKIRCKTTLYADTTVSYNAITILWYQCMLHLIYELTCTLQQNAIWCMILIPLGRKINVQMCSLLVCINVYNINIWNHFVAMETTRCLVLGKVFLFDIKEIKYHRNGGNFVMPISIFTVSLS